MSKATANCAKSAMIVEWPGIPCCHFTGVEQSVIIFLSLNITHYLPTRTEDIPTPFKLCRPPSWLGSFHFLNIDIDLGISCLVTPNFFILSWNFGVVTTAWIFRLLYPLHFSAVHWPEISHCLWKLVCSQVPQRRSLLAAHSESGFKVEVHGGVVVRTPLEVCHLHRSFHMYCYVLYACVLRK